MEDFDEVAPVLGVSLLSGVVPGEWLLGLNAIFEGCCVVSGLLLGILRGRLKSRRGLCWRVAGYSHGEEK